MTPVDRTARILVAAAVLFVAATVHSLALPGGAAACSCARDPGMEPFTGEEDAVFVGTAGQPQPDGTYAFTVETWFRGGNAENVRVASERLVGPDGGTSINTCGLHFEVGDRLIMAAAISGGILSPNTCSPHAMLGTAEAGRMIEAATATFGEGKAPGAATSRDPGSGGLDLATIALGAVGLVLVVALGAVAIGLARRGRPPEAAP